VARIGTVRLQHSFGASSLVFSPDGKTVASAGDDGTAQLWEAATGKEVRRLGGDVSWLQGVAYTPDGKTLIAAGSDTSIHLWDVATGKEIRRLGGLGGNWVRCCALSPDGKFLAASAGDVLHLWDLAAGVDLRQVRRPGILAVSLAFAPDGKAVAAASSDTSVRVYEVATGREAARVAVEVPTQEPVLAYSPTGQLLAVGGADRAIHLWDVGAGKERRRLEGHRQALSAVAFAPDGRLLASAGPGDPLRLWNPAAGEEVRRLQARPDQYRYLAFSPDGRSLAGAGVTGRIYLWDVATGKEQPASAAAPQGQFYAVLAPDGKTVFTWDDYTPWAPASESPIHVWEAETGKEVGRLPGIQGQVRGVAISPDGATLAATAANGTVSLHDPRTGKELRRLPGKHHAVALTAGGRLVTGGLEEPGLRLWHAATGKQLWQLRGLGGLASWYRLAVTPDGGLLAAKGEGRSVHVWDLATGKERYQVPVQRRLPVFAFSSDGRTFATTGSLPSPGPTEWDEVRLWTTATGKEVRAFGRQRVPFTALAFSPDGRTLATGGGDHAVRLWEVATGKERRQFRGHGGAIDSLSFSADGTLLASAGTDRTTLLWGVYRRPRGEAAQAPAEDLEQGWQALAGEDAREAYEAIGRLASFPRQSVALLRRRLRPVVVPDPQALARLMAGLDSERFEERKQAVRELEGLGLAAEPALRRALAGKPSLEARRRIESLVERLEGSEWPRAARAVEALEAMGTADARDLLQALAQGTPESRLTQEARASLERLAKRPAAGPRPQPPAKRARRNISVGKPVRPLSARSARTSPTAGANLKPWPEKPVASTTFGCSGCRSIRK
jgi:WD40 repeat protein